METKIRILLADPNPDFCKMMTESRPGSPTWCFWSWYCPGWTD